MNDELHRPDPDSLLLQATESRRGKLKIFFGACAGRRENLRDAAGSASPAGAGSGIAGRRGGNPWARRNGGAAGWPDVLPRQATRQNVAITEFDLDAALARHPAVILMDELAHSNAPGSRHPKRWQDIEELLDAGMDVMTTVNVQHLESLNDVVGGVTGIRVRETVPDPFFDAADEVVLVDLPAGRFTPAAERGQSLYCRPGRTRH